MSDGIPRSGHAAMMSGLNRILTEAVRGLVAKRQKDGHWVFPLEADVTIPAEYVMLCHYLDRIDTAIEQKLTDSILRYQNGDGGWPLFFGGSFDISATVKAYLALKLAGLSVDSDPMRKARKIIRHHGGAAKANVFTRIALSLYGFLPWRSVPMMPVEIMLLSRRFPFHLDKVSYWSRTVIVPLLILQALKPRARNPKKVTIDELFIDPPMAMRTGQFIRRRPDMDMKKKWIEKRQEGFFIGVNHVLAFCERWIFSRRWWQPWRRRALRHACDWCGERRNGKDGLGAIFPAMANFAMALDALGVDHQSPVFRDAIDSIDRLLTTSDGHVLVQPCLSPVWDTALSMSALSEAASETSSETSLKALPKAAKNAAFMAPSLRWLEEKAVTDVYGDWAVRAPDLKPAGWAFQYNNDYYLDLDDTAVVGMVMDRIAPARYDSLLTKVESWIIGLQSRNGGWGSFDADNTARFLNAIPFADHGALLDPPTADVSGRCIGFLAQRGYRPNHPAMRRGLDYLRGEQEDDGSWYGRWGTNYIYGTWSVLNALRIADARQDQARIDRAADWLIARQRADGGWGEDGRSYWHRHRDRKVDFSTPSQTAWALLGLMAAGRFDGTPVRRGVEWLLAARRQSESWHEDHYTAVGFPRVFYLRYHGYASFFPIWALARYRNLIKGGTIGRYGM